MTSIECEPCARAGLGTSHPLRMASSQQPPRDSQCYNYLLFTDQGTKHLLAPRHPLWTQWDPAKEINLGGTKLQDSVPLLSLQTHKSRSPERLGSGDDGEG